MFGLLREMAYNWNASWGRPHGSRVLDAMESVVSDARANWNSHRANYQSGTGYASSDSMDSSRFRETWEKTERSAARSARRSARKQETRRRGTGQKVEVVDFTANRHREKARRESLKRQLNQASSFEEKLETMNRLTVSKYREKARREESLKRQLNQASSYEEKELIMARFEESEWK